MPHATGNGRPLRGQLVKRRDRHTKEDGTSYIGAKEEEEEEVMGGRVET